MKTVLVMHRGGNSIRGTEICVIESVRALVAGGVRVIVARNAPVMDAMLSGSAVQLTQLDYPEIMLNGTHTTLPLLAWVKTVAAVSRIIREHRPSVIYASGGLPCQVAVPAGRFYNVPVLCHFHHPAIRRDYYLWLVKFADAHVFPSHFTRDHAMAKAGVGGVVVPNGVDGQRFRPAHTRDVQLRTQWEIPSDAVVVGQVGHLVVHKRPDLLLRAFLRVAEQVPPLHLCLVGSGPMLQELRGRIKQIGCGDRVTVTGFVDDVLPWYQHVFDINVLASVEEGLGISVLEGSACGLPAIVSNSTGLRETVVDGETGARVKPDDEAALAEAIVSLARDSQKRRAYGRAARAMVLERFSLDNYREGIVSMLQNLVA